MPHRLNEHRAKIQFVTSARMPSDIYRACVATGTRSNTVYIQRAVCEALARDLDLDLDELLAALPPSRPNDGLFGSDRRRTRDLVGPAGTVEEVR